MGEHKRSRLGVRVRRASARSVQSLSHRRDGRGAERVWQVVGRAALEQVLGTADAGTLEEDARLTALFLWTHQSTDVADGEPARHAKADQVSGRDDRGGAEMKTPAAMSILPW